MQIKMTGYQCSQDSHDFEDILEDIEGINLVKLDFFDIRLEICAPFKEIFTIDIPEELIFCEKNHKHELIFDNEIPISCISIEIFDCRDYQRDYMMRGVFSVQDNKKHWFQHLRYYVDNHEIVNIELRMRDHSDNKESNPYEVFEILEEFGFVNKFKLCLNQLVKIN